MAVMMRGIIASAFGTAAWLAGSAALMIAVGDAHRDYSHRIPLMSFSVASEIGLVVDIGIIVVVTLIAIGNQVRKG